MKIKDKNLESIAEEVGDLGNVKILFNEKTGFYIVKEKTGLFSTLVEYKKPIALGLALLSGSSILAQSFPDSIQYENEDGTPFIQQDTTLIQTLPIPEGYNELESGILMPKLDFNPIASLTFNDKYLLDRGKLYDPNPTITGALGGSLELNKLSLSGLYFVATLFNSDLPNGDKRFLKARENSLLFNIAYGDKENYISIGYNLLDLDVTDKLFKEFTSDIKLKNVKLGAFYDVNHNGGGGYIGFLLDQEVFNKKIQNESQLRFDKGYITQDTGIGLLNKITIPGKYFNIEGKVFIPIYGFENKVDASIGIKINF
jgi:hypothetical protein